MKKILFIAPDYYGFNEVVFDGLQKYSGCRVEHINSTGGYKYRNFGEKIYNFFLKIFCGKNLKKLKNGEHIKYIIQHKKYDYLVVNRPDVLSDENLQIALKNSQKSIVIFWDSIEKIPMQKRYIEEFDVCYSFDKEDCKNFGLKEITNFYFAENEGVSLEYDVCYLATKDNRLKETISVFEYFQRENIKAKAKIFTYPSHPIEEKLPDNMEEINHIIPFAKGYEYCLDSKAILDIAHPHQRGLSFRPFEAMGLGKKVITTNRDIVNYDFYNPNNIFVIENKNNIEIPKSFFETEYQEPSEEIKEKYHIKNWVKQILQ